MIKEFFLAITLGALLGFGVTGTYLALKNKNPSTSTITTQISPTPQLTGKPTESFATPTVSVNNGNRQLTIDSPENESVVTSSQVSLKGTSSPNSSIIITTANQTNYVTTDNSGNFNYNLVLDSGANVIQVDSIDSDDNLTTTQILVTYSTAKF